MKARGSILFLSNGPSGSAAAERAERISCAIESKPTYVLTRQYSRSRSVAEFINTTRVLRPDLVYCVDLAAVPLAASLFAGSDTKVIVDTGDHPSEFLSHVRAGMSKVLAARVMEEFTYRRSNAVVVRGWHHEAVMRGNGVRKVEVIPDGVDLTLVKPVKDEQLRRLFKLDGTVTIGIAGHFTWHEKLGGGVGWELVNALALLADTHVHGVLIGDGPGLGHLRTLAWELGISDRLHIIGKVPYDDYARYLSLIDICLLTQTNDPSSWIRTTGKLPCYLAAGKYMLASAVGTAQRLLPDEMLVPYAGRWDIEYPAKIAQRVRTLLTDPSKIDKSSAHLRDLARPFSYPLVASRAARLINELYWDT